ncbi:MAG TPA: hypothetical protein PLJ47_11510, partial [Candidatus Hydrogenedentes bacterium]|nr:hypothetical protein [Candidatus Hydrogenedentota bacterium]
MLVVLVLIGSIGLSFMIPSLLKPRARDVVDALHEKAQENKNLTKAQLEVYDDLAAVNDVPTVNGMVAIVCAAIFHDHLRDGTLTDAEIAEATLVRDFLDENPNAGIIDTLRFQSKHPEIEKKVRD